MDNNSQPVIGAIVGYTRNTGKYTSPYERHWKTTGVWDAVVKDIQKMLRLGFTPRKMADFINSMDIYRIEGKKMHQDTISGIIRNNECFRFQQNSANALGMLIMDELMNNYANGDILARKTVYKAVENQLQQHFKGAIADVEENDTDSGDSTTIIIEEDL